MAQDINYLRKLIADNEARVGFPTGLSDAVMNQEISGKSDYIVDPSKYHYPQDASGNRKSTAFGPFGILDSTAKDPGYGVKPLTDKSSLEDQARFHADYLAARIKSAGSLQGGLAGYGEGQRYADEVMRRMAMNREAGNGRGSRRAQPTETVVDPTQLAQAPTPVETPPVVEAPPVQVAQAPVAAPVDTGPNEWQLLNARLAAQQANEAPSLDFGVPDMRVAQIAQPTPQVQNRAVNFNAFGKWGTRHA